MKVFRELSWQIFILNLAYNLLVLVNFTSRKKFYICLPVKLSEKLIFQPKY